MVKIMQDKDMVKIMFCCVAGSAYARRNQHSWHQQSAYQDRLSWKKNNGQLLPAMSCPLYKPYEQATGQFLYKTRQFRLSQH